MALYYHNVVVVYYTIISDILSSEKHSGNLIENHPLLLFILGGFLLLELHRRDLLYIMILFENQMFIVNN